MKKDGERNDYKVEIIRILRWLIETILISEISRFFSNASQIWRFIFPNINSILPH